MIKKADIIILALLLLAAGLLYFAARPGAAGATAVIEVDGAEYRRLPLSGADGSTLRVDTASGSCVIAVTAEGARFVSSDCPDGCCVLRGLLKNAGDTAICLPLRVLLRIEGTGGPDAITG